MPGPTQPLPTIDILLATYNGARFLPEQLASLAAQTFTDWRVILRDDGSSDGSPDIVRRWAEQGGHRLAVIEDGRRNLGARGNFAALLEASAAPYFACCDQDDVWLPEKLAHMLERLRAAEADAGPATPVLAYSDLRVVDQALGPIAASFRSFASLQRPRPGREVIDLMTQNVVTGCASLGNAAVREAALPIPDEAIMHDWWLALVCAATGRLVDVPETTMLYRQHGGNTIGAVRWTLGAIAGRLAFGARANFRAFDNFLKQSQAQAGEVVERFGAKLDPVSLQTVTAYSGLRDEPFLMRKRFAGRHLMKPKRVLRNVAFFSLC